MKNNYHTHTYRCKHALGKDEEYVISAIQGGYKTLGFSDHSPWKYNSDFVGRIRMSLYEFKDYKDSILKLKEKYKEQINIKIGLECEYYPKYLPWLKSFIKEEGLDYVILGNHFSESDEYGLYYGRVCKDDKMLKAYVDDCIAGMKTGIYAYLAHPDLFMRGRKTFDKLAEQESYRLCEACKEMGVVLEYNLEGLNGFDVSYPHPKFWEIASKVGNKAIIGVDAHHPDSLKTNTLYEYGIKELNRLNIEIVEDIENCYKMQKNKKDIDL